MTSISTPEKLIELPEEHRPLLQNLIYLTKAQVIVEVGVAEAKTTEWLCEGARLVDGKVYGYDIWDTHGLKNQFQHWSSKEQCEKHLTDRGYTNFELTQIDSKTPEFRELIKTRHPVIDLAFIDGCHSYDGIKNDFEAIYPQLGPFGVIVFHDTLRIDGCREFIIDLRTKYNDGRFDIVEFPFGSMVISDTPTGVPHLQQRHVGIAMLVRRSYAQSPGTIDEICNLEDRSKEIYQKEQDWYIDELIKAGNMTFCTGYMDAIKQYTAHEDSKNK
jgi:predicted O-methyltransferase YrrM